MIVGVALFGINDIAPTAPRVLTLVLVLLTPTAIVAGVVRELREDRRVTVQTIYCGLSLYLLLGLAFAVLFGAIEDIGKRRSSPRARAPARATTSSTSASRR